MPHLGHEKTNAMFGYSLPLSIFGLRYFLPSCTIQDEQPDHDLAISKKKGIARGFLPTRVRLVDLTVQHFVQPSLHH
jgi:hypothetical protein